MPRPHKEAKQVVEIAERDDKGRYQLLDDGSQLRVRAVQGHSGAPRLAGLSLCRWLI